MTDRISRILLVSDFHYMIVPPGKQKGQIIKGFNRITEGIINIWKLWNTPNFMRALSKISTMGEFNLAISNGDIAECVYNERGIVTPKDESVLIDLKQYLKQKIKSNSDAPCKIFYNSGDHELGYKHPLSVDPDGGISQTSFKNYQTIFGPLFSGFSYKDDFYFILLCSSLLIQETNHLKGEEKDYINKLKEDQIKFFKHCLDEVGCKNVFIFLHDPDAVEVLNPIFEKYPQRNFKVFCGHLHAENSLKDYERLGQVANSLSGWLNIARKIFMLSEKGRRLMLWAKGNLRRLEIFKKYDLQIIPATGGMMGKGGGFLILNLFDNGSYQTEKHKT